ncbi:MAG: putative lipoprotein [Candidatus Methylumidiphilus sp.]
MSKPLLSIAVFTMIVLLSACSFSKSSSTSSKSVSDSASSPSSSAPSSKAKKKTGYETDILDYTAEFVGAASTDTAAFRAKLSKIAANYGITQWDADQSTYVAIGKGLRKAGLSKTQYDTYKTSLGDSVPWKMQAIEQGYGK